MKSKCPKCKGTGAEIGWDGMPRHCLTCFGHGKVLKKDYRNKSERKKLFAKQRKIRGWDDSDLWNLDYRLAKWILPRLRRFLEIHSGHPADLSSDKRWRNILQQMIDSFDLIMKQGETGALEIPELKKMASGLQLFARYLPDLWD